MGLEGFPPHSPCVPFPGFRSQTEMEAGGSARDARSTNPIDELKNLFKNKGLAALPQVIQHDLDRGAILLSGPLGRGTLGGSASRVELQTN